MSTPSRASEYEALRAYLAALPRERHDVRLSFKEIEDILGNPLPESAYDAASGWWTRDVEKSPQAYAWTNAGFGVASVACGPSGFVLFVRGLHRWPGTLVESTPLAKQSADVQMRELSLGYVQSARILSAYLGDNPDELSWSRASVPCYCYVLAVELFLKSCIVRREPAFPMKHDIPTLRKKYLALYPEPEFHFETPYDHNLGELAELLGVQSALVKPLERILDQDFRYLRDRQGRPPQGLAYNFAPANSVSMCERLESDIHRIWARIHELDEGHGGNPE